ncbi:MAG: PAS domain-containing protein, partial [Solirubrobacteraceae bacterium]
GDRIAITDELGKIVYVNPALARARNQTSAELIGRSVSELNPPELKHLPGYERYRRTGHDATISQPFVRQIDLGDGRRAPWEISGTGFNVDGTPYVGIIARDLSAATQRLSATMESVSIAIAHVTLDGQFLRFNDHFEVLVGRSAQQLRAYHHVLDVAPPPDQRGLSFIEALGLGARVDMLAIRAHLVTADESYEIEYQLVRPDESRIWIELSIALVRDATSRPAYFVAVGREVTTRHRVDVALRGLVETLTESGDALFAHACSFLGTMLDARCVLIGRLRGAEVEPIAAWRDGALCDVPIYTLVGTPCETVLRSDLCYYPERIQTLFPEDPMLIEIGAHAYLGAAMRSTAGRTIGLIAVLGERAFDPALRAEDMLRLCAARVATDLERLDAAAELGAREEPLRQITETAQETFWLA